MVIAANSVVSETIRVDDLGNKLKLAYQTLAAFTGQVGGSRPKLFIEEVEQKQKEIGPIQQEVRELLEKRESFNHLSLEDLALLLTKIEGYLVHVRRVKEKFIHDLESVERDNQMHHDKEINST